MPEPSIQKQSILTMLLPIMATVFAAFLLTGLSMPALPLHVHSGLGFGTLVVGIAAGAQFAAAFVSRFWSGTCADTKGGKKAVVIGLLIGAAGGILYLLSLRFNDPSTSVVILIIGRGVFGAAESFIVTGALSWGLALGGSKNAGRVMAWVGTAMYVALAVGAPLGTALYTNYGFTSIAIATTILPLLILPWVMSRKFTAVAVKARPSFTRVVRAVWMPGVGLALSSLGFGAITTFVVLLFDSKGWNLGWLALTLFATAFVIARLFLAHLADRVGGAKVATISAFTEAIGLAIIWLAPSPLFAFLGAMITGFGYSLIYPGFGVEAVKRAPPESRGLAMGAFTAFLDLALGIANPLLGFVAISMGLKDIFLVGAIIVFGAALVGIRLLKANEGKEQNISRHTMAVTE